VRRTAIGNQQSAVSIQHSAISSQQLALCIQQSAASKRHSVTEAEAEAHICRRKADVGHRGSQLGIYRATIPRGLVPPDGAEPTLVKIPVVGLMLKMEMSFDAKFEA
jgi:hypothetical protein